MKRMQSKKFQVKSTLIVKTTLNISHTVPLTISCYLFRFLVGQYSVVEMQYFIKKKKKKQKNKFFDEKQQNTKKEYVHIKAFFTVD